MSAKTSLASSLLLTNLATSLASVAIGLGRLDPVDPDSCLDPDTGVSHPLGRPWSLPTSCGQAVCDISHGTVLISYSYCGAASAGEGCYLKRDLSMPYPYCCPRSFCPSNRINDIFSNSVEGDYSYPEEELQMAASQEEASRSLVPAPAQYEVGLDSEEYDYYHYDWDKIFGGFFK